MVSVNTQQNVYSLSLTTSIFSHNEWDVKSIEILLPTKSVNHLYRKIQKCKNHSCSPVQTRKKITININNVV